MVTFDGPNKVIVLDGSLSESIQNLYSRWVDWCNLNLQYLPAFTVVADPPQVPVYATLINGWKIRPLGGSGSAYILNISEGFLYTSDTSDPFVPVLSGHEPRIRWENPVIAVGYVIGGGGTGTLTAIEVRQEMDANSTRLINIDNKTSILPALL